MTTTLVVPTAWAVASRGSPSSRLISPKKLPFSSTARSTSPCLEALVIRTAPDWMTNISLLVSPSRQISSPSPYSRSYSAGVLALLATEALYSPAVPSVDRVAQAAGFLARQGSGSRPRVESPVQRAGS